MPPTTIERYAPADPRLIDAKIAHPLGRLRGIIRRYVAIEGVLAIAALPRVLVLAGDAD